MHRQKRHNREHQLFDARLNSALLGVGGLEGQYHVMTVSKNSMSAYLLRVSKHSSSATRLTTQLFYLTNIPKKLQKYNSETKRYNVATF